jgi:hypothetical protein
VSRGLSAYLGDGKEKRKIPVLSSKLLIYQYHTVMFFVGIPNRLRGHFCIIQMKSMALIVKCVYEK